MTGQLEPIFLSISDGPTDTVDYRNKQLIGYIMVLTLDGSPEVVAQAIWEIIFSEKKIRFVTALDHALHRSNNKDCSFRAHLFLSYNLL